MRLRTFAAAAIGIVLATAPATAGNKLKGKNLFTLFDSLGQTGVWQERLAELSGMNFDSEGNFNYICPISYGGACTGLYGPVSGMQRARNLVEVSKTRSVDYLMMENTNDIGQFKTNLGTIDDQPWFWSYTRFTLDCGLQNEQEAAEYWKTNFASIVGTMHPEAGAVVRVPYLEGRAALELSIVQGPAKDGIVTLHCREFLIPIPVKAGLSAEQLTDCFLSIGLRPGCDWIKKSATSLCYIDYIKTNNPLTIDCGDTGVVINVTDTPNLKTYDRFFVGKGEEDWQNPDCWTAAPSLYSQWKGFVEYIVDHFPKANKYWMIPTYYMCSPENAILKDAYFTEQKRLAKHYHIKVLDVAAHAGITEENVLDFYEQGNVHPLDAGYRRWGETAYKLLK